MATTQLVTRHAATSTAIAQRTSADAPTAIVGLRADGTAIVVIEPGGAETRCQSSSELWLLITRLVNARPEHVVVDDSLKDKRRKLFDAFSVLASKGRERLADRVGEDTVSAVETIAGSAVSSAVGFMRRTAVQGTSSLGRRYGRETSRKK